MKNLNVFVTAVSAIMIVSALAGFMIVHSVAPDASWAALLVDLAALLALVSACYTIPKMPEFRTEEIADALRDLALGRYERRLIQKDFDGLTDIAQAFNELAGTLSDNSDPSLTRARSGRMGKPEPLVHRPVMLEQHSYHPELGQVQPIQIPVQSPKSSLHDLYEQFKEAHRLQGQETVDFDSFEDMISKTRDQLIQEHNAKSVRFEVVTESGSVALRPRLVR